MKKITNKTYVEGFLYDHKLSLKTAGEKSKNPGSQFINGSVMIETSPGNVITVFFPYVADNGKTANFKILKSILDETVKTLVKSSREEAGMIKVDSSIGVNDFYNIKDDTLVSAQRNEGGFIHVITGLNDSPKTRNSFLVDAVITNIKEVEADEEKDIQNHLVLKCATFNYRKDLLPFTLTVTNKEAIAYFMNHDFSEKPMFTQLWGNQESKVFKKKTVLESAFGENEVRESEYNRKYWVVTGAKKIPYEWDSEEFITAKEFKDSIAARELLLAEVKQNRLDYESNKATGKPIAKDPYNF